MLVGTKCTPGMSYVFTMLGQQGQGSVCYNRPQSGVDAREHQILARVLYQSGPRWGLNLLGGKLQVKLFL